jgi:hypothetical protein
MATRKKKAKRASKARGAAQRAQSAIARWEAELPKNLRDYVKQVEQRLNRLEGQIGRAGVRAQKEALRLLRDAGKQLGSLEARGERAWAKLTAAAEREARGLLGRLEDALSPARAPKKAKKKARRRVAKKKA